MRPGLVPLLQAGWGAALVAAPDRVAATVAGHPLPPAWLVRLLGARTLGQAVLLAAVPTPAVRRGAAATDGLHAASMVPAALLWPAYRRAALVSGAVAALSAAGTLRRPAGRTSAGHPPTAVTRVSSPPWSSSPERNDG